MKVQVIYSSLTGCTEKVAKTIYEQINTDEKSIHNLKDGIPTLDGDILLIGYWGIGGGPQAEVKDFLQTIEGKAVGVFCTLGYYADSTHAYDTVQTGINLLKEKNEIIGSYVCNGAISSKLTHSDNKTNQQNPTEQKEIRWEIMKAHPTSVECALAAERFQERVALYSRCKEYGIDFQSTL